MATIYKTFTVQCPVSAAWDALRDVGEAHRRLFPGVLTGTTLEGDSRTVTFANGMVVRERIVGLDEVRHRLAYAATGGRASHHNASFQVMPLDTASCEVVWITDVLPDELAPGIEGLMNLGARAMQNALNKP